MPFSLCLVSHQHLLRALLREHLVRHCGARVLAEFASGEDLLQHAAKIRGVDLLLLDGELPDCAPLDDLKTLFERCRPAKIAILTDSTGTYLFHRAIQLGLHGVLHKRDELEVFVSAVKTILSGGLFISPNISIAERSTFARVLSEREIAVLSLLTTGHSATSAAQRLRLSPATLQTHRRNCLRKLGLNTQLELQLYALRAGLTALDRTSRPLRSKPAVHR